MTKCIVKECLIPPNKGYNLCSLHLKNGIREVWGRYFVVEPESSSSNLLKKHFSKSVYSKTIKHLYDSKKLNLFRYEGLMKY